MKELKFCHVGTGGSVCRGEVEVHSALSGPRVWGGVTPTRGALSDGTVHLGDAEPGMSAALPGGPAVLYSQTWAPVLRLDGISGILVCLWPILSESPGQPGSGMWSRDAGTHRDECRRGRTGSGTLRPLPCGNPSPCWALSCCPAKALTPWSWAPQMSPCS